MFRITLSLILYNHVSFLKTVKYSTTEMNLNQYGMWCVCTGTVLGSNGDVIEWIGANRAP